VARLAPSFQAHLQTLLAQVEDSLAPFEDSLAPAPVPARTDAGSIGPALTLIAQAEPLVARGDYAAHDLLEQLAAKLPDMALVEDVRTAYDELELDAAGAALQKLKTTLQEGGQ
jgi:hypothetical protein